ncbi:PhzF family phenazine biosynthesis protein [Coralloluteibacterium thermophilus]|uniref:PhzF family phenazine biosynthesis protein n=1 Tax=Coralloluteibacterium thermophilum TaxID=2707049 RepID=A0ABV9NJ49_9GAMM
MSSSAFKQVDVFARSAFAGNPVAVILDGVALDDAAMQRIARWTNLSETTFVLPPTQPQADYRLRIFTPERELPFAGHPSVGSAHAVLEAGLAAPREGRLVQECGAGLLPVRVLGEGEERELFVRAPEPALRRLDAAQVDALLGALGIGPDALASPAVRAIDIGPVWITLRLRDAARVRALRPDMRALAAAAASAGAIGANVFGSEDGGGADYAVRSFCPGDGIDEDPVCGSGNAAVAAWLRADGAAQGEWVASQGREIGRDGRVAVRLGADGSIEIGGRATTRIEGWLRLQG